MSLVQAVSKIQENLEAMREVTVIMHYGIDGHPDVISQNVFAFPPKTDVIDRKALNTMRTVWLDALSRPNDGFSRAFSFHKPETAEDILAAALQKTVEDSKVEAAFVKASRLPVPSEYSLMLPMVRKGLREEILTHLVPFEETRAMLLRLENSLELPMRYLEIGHVPVNAVVELQASISQSSQNTLTLH